MLMVQNGKIFADLIPGHYGARYHMGPNHLTLPDRRTSHDQEDNNKKDNRTRADLGTKRTQPGGREVRILMFWRPPSAWYIWREGVEEDVEDEEEKEEDNDNMNV